MNGNDEKPDYTGPTTTIEIPAGLIREGETGQEAGTRLFRTMMEQREEWLRAHPEDEGAIRRIMTGIMTGQGVVEGNTVPVTEKNAALPTLTLGTIDLHAAYMQEKKRADYFRSLALAFLARLGGDVTLSALSTMIQSWELREMPMPSAMARRYVLCDKDGNIISTKDDDNEETVF